MQDKKRGIVEGGNGYHDPDGLTQGETDLLKSGSLVRVEGEGLAIKLGALKGCKTNDFSGTSCFAASLEEALAVLGTDDLGNVFGALLSKRGCSEKDCKALVGGGETPDFRSNRGCG